MILRQLIALAVLTPFHSLAQKSVFEKGIISTDQVEYGATFTPDRNEFYFTRTNGEWAKNNATKTFIYFSRKLGGQWSEPEIASFSGNHEDSEPHISLDGLRLFFVSNRPSDNINIASEDIWLVQRVGNSWGTPRNLGKVVNSPKTEYSPYTSQNGDLYFASNRDGGLGQGDIYVSRYLKEEYQMPENLGSAINTALGEWNVAVNPPASIILYEASQRETNLSSFGDLYISYNAEGVWSESQPLTELNTTGSELYPYFHKSGELFFSSTSFKANTDADIYKIDFSALSANYIPADSSGRKLLVVNRSAHSLAVVNLETGEIVRKITTGKGPHEVAVSEDGRFAFVANYGTYPVPHEAAIEPNQLEWISETGNSLTIINLSNYTSREVQMPDCLNPHGITANGNGSIVWATCEDADKVVEIDAQTGRILRSYTTMKGSHIVKYSAQRNKLFVSNIESNTITIINLDSGQSKHLQMDKGPEGLAFSPDHNQLWVSCTQANTINVVDLEKEEVVHSFESQGRFPVKIDFTSDGKAWVVNVFSHNLATFDAKTYEFLGKVPLETSPLGIKTVEDKVYVTLPRKNLIRVIDSSSHKTVMEFSPGIEPDGMELLPQKGN